MVVVVGERDDDDGVLFFVLYLKPQVRPARATPSPTAKQLDKRTRRDQQDARPPNPSGSLQCKTTANMLRGAWPQQWIRANTHGSNALAAKNRHTPEESITSADLIPIIPRHIGAAAHGDCVAHDMQ